MTVEISLFLFGVVLTRQNERERINKIQGRCVLQQASLHDEAAKRYMTCPVVIVYLWRHDS